jgi:hypothetical protein
MICRKGVIGVIWVEKGPVREGEKTLVKRSFDGRCSHIIGILPPLQQGVFILDSVLLHGLKVQSKASQGGITTRKSVGSTTHEILYVSFYYPSSLLCTDKPLHENCNMIGAIYLIIGLRGKRGRSTHGIIGYATCREHAGTWLLPVLPIGHGGDATIDGV